MENLMRISKILPWNSRIMAQFFGNNGITKFSSE